MSEQAPEGMLLFMQRTVNEAQELLEKRQLERMKAYFTPEGEPLVERFTLSGGKTLEVPRYSLVPQSCLVIDELRLRYTYPIGAVEAKSFREADDTEAVKKNPSALRAFFSALWRKLKRGPRDLIEVTAIFKRSDG
jgi:hypothetical protein